MRYISGIQPTGELHLGNYFGAIQQHLKIQNKVERPEDALFFIADYHALTNSKLSQVELRAYSYNVAVTYLALGLDPDKCIIFRQSRVPGDPHTALALILSNNVGVGALERSHAYATKIAQGLKSNVGLFYYPVLMAADILLYDVDLVPVGGDQTQHIEMTADIAQSFNFRYGEIFKRPEAQFSKASRILGTNGSKMGKSNKNTIPILGAPKVVRKKIMSIKTDSTDFTQEPLNPDNCVVFHLYSLFANTEEISALRELYLNDRKFGYGHAKQMLFEKHQQHFAEAYSKYEEYLNDRNYVEDILYEGAVKAADIANQKLSLVKQAVGLL